MSLPRDSTREISGPPCETIEKERGEEGEGGTKRGKVSKREAQSGAAHRGKGVRASALR